jgi:glucan 1,3-beta-glucosidase
MWILLSVAMTTLLAATTVQAVPIQLHGLNYNTRQGPDWDRDKCKSRATIQTELALHKLLTNRIRILSLTDCDQGNLVTSVAKEFGMQLYLGMWVGPEDFVFEEEKGALQNMIDQGLLSDGTVLGITVGSEAIYRKDATVNELIRNMNEGM